MVIGELDDGGYGIEGTDEELLDLILTIGQALYLGVSEGQILSDEGVETLTVKILK
jgi:hypothetical protein